MSKKQMLDFKPSDIKKELKDKKKAEMKKQIDDSVNTVKTIIEGAKDLVLSASLLIVTWGNIYDLMHRNVGDFEYYTRLVASVVIGLLGARAIVRIFRSIGESK